MGNRDYLLLLMEDLRNRQYIYGTNRIATPNASFFEVGIVPLGLSQKRQTPLLAGVWHDIPIEISKDKSQTELHEARNSHRL